MEKYGIILIIILFLWLILHKEKNQNKYNYGLASGASLLPQLTRHYVGLN